VYGLVIAHAGLGLTLAGIAGISAWSSENILTMRPGDKTGISDYGIYLESIGPVTGPNYSAEAAKFRITRGGADVTALISERRFYPVREQQTTVAGIRTNLISNIYVALGEPDAKGAWAVRIYYHPLAPWIWLGGFVMAFGGFISLADRRFRVGAPQPTRKSVAPSLAMAEITP